MWDAVVHFDNRIGWRVQQPWNHADEQHWTEGRRDESVLRLQMLDSMHWPEPALDTPFRGLTGNFS